MSIRFKFRSSVNFDTVDIGGRDSISVRELRSKILSEKTLGAGRQQHQDFDLVFLDADSGQEYKDGDINIPSGSSVIVKRVPAGTVPSDLVPIETVKGLEVKVSCQMNPISKPADKFEDFGSGFCPPPEPDANCLDFDLEFDQNNLSSSEREDITRLRSGCQKLDSCDISQAVPRGSVHNGNERNILPEPTAEELMKLPKNRPANFVALQNANFPLELKCSLCNTFFKDAVMIPCCQHSFCEKCIRLVLIEKRRCPKCFSSKCRVDDLLPNLSLRNAIKHCLESQIPDAGFETAMEKYAPDEESGIEVKKDASCALTVVQREAELPQSSSATGIGSNQIFTESYYEPVFRKNTQYKGSDTQGGNLPDIPRALTRGEGGDRNFLAHSGYKKGVRNCYTCGSPDHLMRDCPLASNLHPFQQGNGAFHGGVRGYSHPYWNGSMLPFRPYANMYSNPTVMPFNVSMVPMAPFAVPPYFPSTGVGLHGPGGNMGTGGMGPPLGNRVQRFPFSNLELQHFEDRKKLSNENFGREKLLDEEDSHECRRDNKPDIPHRCESMKEKEHSLCRSEDGKTRRSQRQYEHDNYMDYGNRYFDERLEKSSHSSSLRAKRLHHSERSNSGIEAMSRSSDRHSERRHKDHRGESKHHKRVECDSDSSLTRSPLRKDVIRRDVVVARDLHVDWRGECKERDSGHDSRQSRHLPKHTIHERHEDKWQMVSGSNDYKDDHRQHKRKRV